VHALNVREKMKSALVIAITLWFLPCGNLLAGQKPVPVESWLQDKHNQLAAVGEPASIKRSKLSQSAEPDKDGLYSMYPENGFLQFPDGSWILLTSHSAHKEDGLPDVTLIRTSKGEFYYNLGHCCLPILLFSKEKVDSLDTFLKTTGKGPKAAPTVWAKFDREQAVPSDGHKPSSRDSSTDPTVPADAH
jgi:hypothetical protein